MRPSVRLAVSVDCKSPFRFAEYLDTHHQRFVGNQRLDLLGPLDQTEVARIEILLVAEVERFGNGVDAVEIEVIHRTLFARAILIHYGECGACYGVVRAEPLHNRADERRFACAHRTAKRHDRPTLQRLDYGICHLRQFGERIYRNCFHLSIVKTPQI